MLWDGAKSVRVASPFVGPRDRNLREVVQGHVARVSELKVGELAALSCSYEENCAVDEALGGKKERTAVGGWWRRDEILEGIKDCKYYIALGGDEIETLNRPVN
jgi:hypothetical protein